MRRDLSKEEFNEWKINWLKEKGCPFFTCAQATTRKVCGKDYLCGVLFNYEDYKENKWKQVCDIDLEMDKDEEFPANCCPSCTNSMCLNTEEKIGQSCCPYMNDYYEDELKIKVNRSCEKYFLTMGSFLIPSIGEQAYIDLYNNLDSFKKYLEVNK